MGVPPSRLVVADPRGPLFERLAALDLGLAVWRTTRPDELELDEGSVLVVAAYADPPWATVRRNASRCPTIIVATAPSGADALRALREGAVGYLDASLATETLRRTVRGVIRGESAFGRAVLGEWISALPRHPVLAHDSRSDLTARQREVVDLIAVGSTDRQIGVALGIRPATAQKHVAHVLRRLKVAKRAAVVGLFVTDDPAASPPDLPGAGEGRAGRLD